MWNEYNCEIVWILQRHGSAVTCHKDRGSGCGRPGNCGMWNKLEEVAISSTVELLSRWPTNHRTIIPKKFSHSCKNSRAHNRFPNLRICQRNWEPPGNLTLKAKGLDYRTSTGLGKLTLGGHKQNLVQTRTKEKGEVTPKELESDLLRGCLGVSSWGMGLWSGALNTTVLGAVVCWDYSYHRLASGQTTGREHSPTHQQIIEIKI